MLDYAGPMGRMGATGGGLFGTLGRVLEPLDYPRQALWNLPGRLSQGDWTGAIPGLAGLAAGGALAATGFGLPLAGLAGSAIGGVLQGGGKNSEDPEMAEHFDAPAPSALVEAMGVDPESWGGMGLGMGLGMAGDPLQWTLPFAGRALGRTAGTGLEGAARARGPRFGASPSVFETPPVPRAPSELPGLQERLAAMKTGPHAQTLLNELEPGAQAVGAGAEGMVFRAPGSPTVTRIGGGPGALDITRGIDPDDLSTLAAPQVTRLGRGPGGISRVGPEAAWARTENPLLLQPGRSVSAGPYTVEHLPAADVLPSQYHLGSAQANMPIEQRLLNEQVKTGGDALQEALGNQGLTGTDIVYDTPRGRGYNPGNVGRLPGGNMVLTDPGTILPGRNLVLHPSVPEAGKVNPLLDKLLGWMGSEQGVRQEILEAASPGRLAGQGLNAAEIERLTGRALPTMEDAQRGQLIPLKAGRQENWQKLLREVEDAQARGLDPLSDPIVKAYADAVGHNVGQVQQAQHAMGLPVGPMATNMRSPWEALLGRGVPQEVAQNPIQIALEHLRQQAAEAAIGTRPLR